MEKSYECKSYFVNGNIVYKFVKHVYPSMTVFQLGTRNYPSIAVLITIAGLFVHLVPNISDYRLPQLQF
jgi:hypothetical protein